MCSLLSKDPTTAGILGAAGNPAFLSLVGSRIMLHLKAQGRSDLDSGVSHMETLTAIDFDYP